MTAHNMIQQEATEFKLQEASRLRAEAAEVWKESRGLLEIDPKAGVELSKTANRLEARARSLEAECGIYPQQVVFDGLYNSTEDYGNHWHDYPGQEGMVL
jgi:hypothetical protein